MSEFCASERFLRRSLVLRRSLAPRRPLGAARSLIPRQPLCLTLSTSVRFRHTGFRFTKTTSAYLQRELHQLEAYGDRDAARAAPNAVRQSREAHQVRQEELVVNCRDNLANKVYYGKDLTVLAVRGLELARIADLRPEHDAESVHDVATFLREKSQRQVESKECDPVPRQVSYKSIHEGRWPWDFAGFVRQFESLARLEGPQPQLLLNFLRAEGRGVSRERGERVKRW